jgi:hypothetical protein
LKVDPRFLKEEGTEVFLGNELIVKGLLAPLDRLSRLTRVRLF